MPDPGKIMEYPDKEVEVEAKLFNFRIAKYQLKPEHENWLRKNIVPLLKAGGSLALLGLASTTDKESFNLVLSRRRADSVVDFLRKEVSNKFKVVLNVAMGEKSARYAGVRDGFEDENWRAVVIAAWKKPDPPPPPPVPKPLPQAPLFERTTNVYFLAENEEDIAPEDGRLAKAGFDWAMGKINDSRRAMFIEQKKEKFPATYRVREIWTFLHVDEFNSGVSRNRQKYCRILYNWGVDVGPCVLVHGYWRDGAFKTANPHIYVLNDKYVDLFVDNPLQAVINVSSWNLHRYKYEDWQKGKLY